jgi:hypothetical protein
MRRKPERRPEELLADPFGEHAVFGRTAPMDLLGARIVFESPSKGLLRLVEDAFGSLPAHRFSARMPRLAMTLLTGPTASKRRGAAEPPPLYMQSGGGYLIGAAESSSFVCLDPVARKGLVSVAKSTLRFSYHTRYELIEFAVFTLASRCQGLVSMHGACVALDGRAVLLMGASGAGKSTVTLHCLLNGFDMVSEDSVFVHPGTLRATGLANFLHVTADSLHWVARAEDAAAIRASPVIRRRSGVRKYEVNLRRGRFGLAASPPTLAAVVFLSPETAGRRPLLTPMSRSDRRTELALAQSYAANQPTWPGFERALGRIDAFLLRRGAHPRDSVEALAALLARSSTPIR